MTPRRVAVIGGGWAGLAAAVQSCLQGLDVTLFEMAPRCGGRARSSAGDALDNGQHILIGAYRETLALMRRVGVDPGRALVRQPLVLRMADGRELRLGGGPPALAFVLAVLRCRAWSAPERLALLRLGSRWLATGFRCDPDVSVDTLCRPLPRAVRELLIDPLCVAALNTPAHEASAAVFLRVLQDGLFGGPGASDLLLPRRPLQRLLPQAAEDWLRARGASVHLGTRVQVLARNGDGWRVDGQRFDQVVLACTATEAARLARPWAADWSTLAQALRFEPIVTVYLQHDGAALPLPMLALAEDEASPAQFVFDQGQLQGRPGLFAFVVSGAARWVQAGRDATAAAVQQQAARQLAACGWRRDAARLVDLVAERRATFRSTPGLQRPAMAVAPGLWAAGDYVAGPYPATLEGAVRAGLAAAAGASRSAQAAFHDAE